MIERPLAPSVKTTTPDFRFTSLAEMAERLGVTFPMLLDRDSKVADRYQISGFPESYIIGADGKMVMFMDSPSNEPVVRIVGPRPWDSPTMNARIAALLPR